MFFFETQCTVIWLWLFVSPSDYLPVCLSVCLCPACLPVYFSVCVCLSVCLPLCLFVSVTVTTVCLCYSDKPLNMQNYLLLSSVFCSWPISSHAVSSFIKTILQYWQAFVFVWHCRAMIMAITSYLHSSAITLPTTPSFSTLEPACNLHTA